MLEGHIHCQNTKLMVFHFHFTPLLVAERKTSHESAVIMVKYCTCTFHFFIFFFFLRMNVPTNKIIVLECSPGCTGFTAVQQRVNSALSLLEHGRNRRITFHLITK